MQPATLNQIVKLLIKHGIHFHIGQHDRTFIMIGSRKVENIRQAGDIVTGILSKRLTEHIQECERLQEVEEDDSISLLDDICLQSIELDF